MTFAWPEVPNFTLPTMNALAMPVDGYIPFMKLALYPLPAFSIRASAGNGK